MAVAELETSTPTAQLWQGPVAQAQTQTTLAAAPLPKQKEFAID